MKNKKEILEKLIDDEHYYGEYGRQFISNYDIRNLINSDPDKYEAMMPEIEKAYREGRVRG